MCEEGFHKYMYICEEEVIKATVIHLESHPTGMHWVFSEEEYSGRYKAINQWMKMQDQILIWSLCSSTCFMPLHGDIRKKCLMTCVMSLRTNDKVILDRPKNLKPRFPKVRKPAHAHSCLSQFDHNNISRRDVITGRSGPILPIWNIFSQNQHEIPFCIDQIVVVGRPEVLSQSLPSFKYKLLFTRNLKMHRSRTAMFTGQSFEFNWFPNSRALCIVQPSL